jgi:tetratricopeptide (TPR) repeat protein
MLLTLLVAVGSAGEWSATETAASPGPALIAPSAPYQRAPSADNPAAQSLVEMPIADTAPPTSATNAGNAPAEAAGAKSSPLPTTDAAEDRSLQLEQVARQADRQTRHGFELAERGAYFAARAEFLGALRLVAESLDAERQTKVHGRALAAALIAVKEAEDFLPGPSRAEADLDLPGIIAIHTTPVLKNNAEQVAPLAALRCYFTFAQEQFAAAVGREVAGSMALHAMGKLHSAWAQKKGTPVVAPESKAVVFYQAALLVYPKNYMAANDLGVLLAQCGHYADARAMLEHSLSLRQQSTGWQNLAVVYRQLGQTVLATQAAQRAARLRQSEMTQPPGSSAWANDRVLWVDPRSFAQTSTNATNPPGAIPMPDRPSRLAVDAGRTATAGRPVAATVRPASPAGATGGLSCSPDPAAGPAPTPAAAQRMSWGSPAYQR